MSVKIVRAIKYFEKLLLLRTFALAVHFLLSNGYEKYNELHRMVMGEKYRWYPEKILNRGTGYAG